MHRVLILAAIFLVVGGAGVTHVRDLDLRLSRLAVESRRTPPAVEMLDREMDRLRLQIEELRTSLSTADAEDGSVSQDICSRLDEIEGALDSAQTGFAEQLLKQDGRLDSLVQFSRTYGPDTFDRKVREAQSGVMDQYEGLTDIVANAMTLARKNQDAVDRLHADKARDVDVMWRELVGPTVQLAGESTVGSGILLKSRQVKGSEDFETLLITSWHVVRDIQAEADGDRKHPVPVAIYGESGNIWYETAELLHHDAKIDAALLRMNVSRELPNGATLAPRSRLENMRIFEKIIAVGCPLGNDPIPTSGEIADTKHRVDGNEYWMISAPTYIGNSGGGIFDGETHQLLGIFSKIYTHGSLRPTVVPHMGLVTPLLDIYDWLEDEGFAHLEDAGDDTGSLVACLGR